jgi:hypothetical protein
MKALLAILIDLIVYPVFGTLMFAILDRVRISVKAKAAVVCYGHPILTGLLVWLCIFSLDREVATIATLFIAGSLLWTPFRGFRFLTGLHKSDSEITIKFLTSYLSTKTLIITRNAISSYELSAGRTVLSKPTVLKLTTSENEIKLFVFDPDVQKLNQDLR